MAFRQRTQGAKGRGAAWEPAKLGPVYWGLEEGSEEVPQESEEEGGVGCCCCCTEPFSFFLPSCWEATSIKRKRAEEFAVILNI